MRISSSSMVHHLLSSGGGLRLIEIEDVLFDINIEVAIGALLKDSSNSYTSSDCSWPVLAAACCLASFGANGGAPA